MEVPVLAFVLVSMAYLCVVLVLGFVALLRAKEADIPAVVRALSRCLSPASPKRVGLDNEILDCVASATPDRPAEPRCRRPVNGSEHFQPRDSDNVGRSNIASDQTRKDESG
jgi:hypothetical protein